MIKIIVCGARGRMGQQVILEVQQTPTMKLIGAIESTYHPELGKKVNEEVAVSSDLEEVVQEGAVIIEFTTPRATLEHLRVAKCKRVPMVIGTTGFQAIELNKIKEASRSIPILLSPNMSIGINLLFKLVQISAETLGKEFDKEVIEIHHRKKKDAPSGTAKRIAQILAQTEKEKLDRVGVFGREGIMGERKKEEIGIHAVRGGSVVGEHTVLFAGKGERLEITHRAESRQIFARGAILSAKFIAQKEVGLYDLQDVLGIK